ncbi:hypothetical protein NBRC110019_27940 [Neptunitalea chrysea]|uniref:Glycosyl hydrolase family 13 catalytic domain-containing protein n=1 Tax=Neptunitalea chrysea TaxID=1647581 RepID=A0A9W6EWV3_9FLAO|nr:alpha-amylase family glycosyl hydrolase [Neptunitalea chrysea]GLB53753.1 hypothetical protein NBRC110019_27940 [Neptunitalea chrysea]
MAFENSKEKVNTAPFVWESANVYFLITDRFCNGETDNDVNFERNVPTGNLRGFMGGDLKGITRKIREGYFTNLGINAIWFTPIVEQIHGCVDEGDGNTYGYHGYWAKDWSQIDPNFGTLDDLKELVAVAHDHGIRLLMDIVINHTGPITENDPVWPDEWVRTGRVCNYSNYENTTDCMLVANLPDVKTESNEDVELPQTLIDKWTTEGRLEQEVKELDDFFERTKYPRSPKHHIVKWLTDYVRECGIDGFRVDTVKHVEEDVWSILRTEADYAFDLWKKENTEKALDDTNFFIVGEVYGYGVMNGQWYDFGDKKVNYFEHGFNALINFNFKNDARGSYEDVFSKTNYHLQNELKDYSTMNYATSHDDSDPFDRNRERPFNAATKLLLSPGISQIYYGDETARPLWVDGVKGDANLRSFMNWGDITGNPLIKNLFRHYSRLGQFRIKHPAVGAGEHKMISKYPYVFSRHYEKGAYSDTVLIAIDVPEGEKTLYVGDTFRDDTLLLEFYSHIPVVVKNKKTRFRTPFSVVLLAKESPENI